MDERKLTISAVNKIFRQCAYPIGKRVPNNAIIVEGVSGEQAFNPQKIAAWRKNILDMLAELPAEAHFACLNTNTHNEVWSVNPMWVDMLLMLGMAVGAVSASPDRGAWSLCPDGMPYVSINLENQS
jgi:hypothetical protein